MPEAVWVAVIGGVSLVGGGVIGPIVTRLLGRESQAVTTLREVAGELRAEKLRVDVENASLRERLTTAAASIRGQAETISRLEDQLADLRREMDRHTCTPATTQGDVT